MTGDGGRSKCWKRKARVGTPVSGFGVSVQHDNTTTEPAPGGLVVRVGNAPAVTMRPGEQLTAAYQKANAPAVDVVVVFDTTGSMRRWSSPRITDGVGVV